MASPHTRTANGASRPLNSQSTRKLCTNLEGTLHRRQAAQTSKGSARWNKKQSAMRKKKALKEAQQMKYTMGWIAILAGLLALGPISSAKDPDEARTEQDRLQNAGKVMQEILHVPDDIPQDLLDKARCVVVMPSVLKAAFVVGGSYGRGVMVCRNGHNFRGPWGAPAMYALEGGSFGFQIGGEATDFVILLMNDRAVSSLLHSKVKLGGDASIA